MQQFVTSRGFNVVIYPTDSPIATTRVFVNAGSAHETDVPWGTAHFLEHMFFKGTEKRPFQELLSEIAKIGDSNAWTSFGMTCYHISTTGTHLKRAMELLYEQVFLPTFPQEELDKEKSVIHEEWMQSQDQPSSVFYYATWLALQGDEAHPVLGTDKTIQEITRDDIIRFRSANYTKANMLFVLAGDVADLTIEDVEAALAPYDVEEGVKNPPLDLPADLGTWDAPTSVNVSHVSTQAQVGLWLGGFDSEELKEDDYAQKVFFNALGGGLHSLLFERIREELGLAYSVSAYNNAGIGSDTVSLISSLTSPENVPKMVEEIRTLLERVKQEGINEDRLVSAHGNLLFRSASAMDSVGSVINDAASNFFRHDGDIETYGIKRSYEILCKLDPKTIDCCRFMSKMLQRTAIAVLNGPE